MRGVQVRPVMARGGGIMDADAVERGFRPPSPHYPEASLVCVENTHNGAGGKVTGAGDLAAIRAVADANRLPVHMDGARLANAIAATNAM